MSDDEELSSIAGEIDDLAERLADRALELLRAATGSAPQGDEAARERVVTRARRSLEKAATLLRGAP